MNGNDQSPSRILIKRALHESFTNRFTNRLEVYLNRPVNVQTNNNYIQILTLSEDSEIFDESERSYKRTLFLNFEIGYFPLSNESYFDQELEFDAIIDEVERVLTEDEHIRNLVSESYLDNIQYRTEAEGDVPAFIGNVNFRCIYYQTVGTPETSPLANVEDISEFRISSDPD